MKKNLTALTSRNFIKLSILTNSEFYCILIIDAKNIEDFLNLRIDKSNTSLFAQVNVFSLLFPENVKGLHQIIRANSAN